MAWHPTTRMEPQDDGSVKNVRLALTISARVTDPHLAPGDIGDCIGEAMEIIEERRGGITQGAQSFTDSVQGNGYVVDVQYAWVEGS